MSDLIRLELGREPWKPTPDSQVVVQYRYYDMPLAGVLRQGSLEYLFICLDGEDEKTNLWLYASLDREQRAALDAAGAEINTVLHQMPLHGWSRLALASEARGIVDHQDADGTTEGAQVALGALLDRMDELQSGAHQLQLT